MKELLTKNFTPAENKKNEYIVIHYTGNPNTSAENNAKYFYTTKNKVSAHYVIDEKNIYKCVSCNNIAWHVGGAPEDKNYHPYYKKATNNNTIGIELCCIGDLEAGIYYNPETIKNAVKLTCFLMIQYSIPISRIITHRDVTGKQCPRDFSIENFKKEVRKMLEDIENIETMKAEIELLKNDIKYLKTQLERCNKKIIHYWSEITDEEQYIILRNLYDKGIIRGKSPQDLSLSEDTIRMLVYNARAGLYNNL